MCFRRLSVGSLSTAHAFRHNTQQVVYVRLDAKMISCTGPLAQFDFDMIMIPYRCRRRCLLALLRGLQAPIS